MIDRIPQPPIWPGKRNQPADDYEAMQGEEDDCVYNDKGGKRKNTKQDHIKSLMTREISNLSQVAWDVLKPKYDHPAPTVAIKWKSPDAKIFTSRKTAWEYATTLSKQEVAIERNLKGIGASGKLLKEFVPTAKTALEIGRLRFIRDGLWVVGQELSWQADREDELLAQEEELEQAASSKIYTTGLQLFVAENRNRYRDENGTNLTQADKALRHQWRCLPPKEQEVWNEKVQQQFEDSSVGESDSESEDKNNSGESCDQESDESSVEYISPLQYFVQQRRDDYRHEQQMKLEGKDSSTKKRFTLAQADKELRQQWKEMNEKQQDEWIEKLEKMEEVPASKDKSQESNEEKALAVVARGESSEMAAAQSLGDSKIATIDKGKSGEEIITESNTNNTISSKTNTDKNGLLQELNGRTGFEEEKKTEEPDSGTKQPPDPPQNAISTVSIGANVKTSSPVKVPTVINMNQKSKGGKQPEKNGVDSTRKEATKRKQAKNKPSRKATPKYCLKPEQINQCYEACMEHYDSVMRTVKNRDLARELADGFDVLRERGHGRFDMEIPAFDTPDFSFLNSFEKTSWMPIVHAILGDDVVLIHKGAFMSLPGAGAQVYHQDGVHLTTQTQRPCHAINVFVPLVDLHSRNGPTEFVLGSHVLGHDGYDRDFLETPKPKAGTPVIFDYRLGHRGMANSSQHCRPIVYCTYARAADGKEFRDSVNFSRKRYHKIGDLSAKPLSREERRNKRKRSIESARQKEEIEKVAKVSATEKPSEGETHDIGNKTESEAKGENPIGKLVEGLTIEGTVVGEAVNLEKSENNSIIKKGAEEIPKLESCTSQAVRSTTSDDAKTG